MIRAIVAALALAVAGVALVLTALHLRHVLGEGASASAGAPVAMAIAPTATSATPATPATSATSATPVSPMPAAPPRVLPAVPAANPLPLPAHLDDPLAAVALPSAPPPPRRRIIVGPAMDHPAALAELEERWSALSLTRAGEARRVSQAYELLWACRDVAERWPSPPETRVSFLALRAAEMVPSNEEIDRLLWAWACLDAPAHDPPATPALLCLAQAKRTSTEMREDLSARYAQVVLDHAPNAVEAATAQLALGRALDRQHHWREALPHYLLASKGEKADIRVDAIKARLILGERFLWNDIADQAASALLVDPKAFDQDRAWALAARARARFLLKRIPDALADCDALDLRYPKSTYVAQAALVRRDVQRSLASSALP